MEDRRYFIHSREPLYQLVSKLPVWRVWLYMLIIHTLIWVVVGLLVEHYYPCSNYLSIRTRSEIAMGLNAWTFTIPIIWTYFRWFPEAVFHVLKELENDRILQRSFPPTSLSYYLRKFPSWARCILSLLPSLFSAVLCVIFDIYFAKPQQFKNLGKEPFWSCWIWSKVIYFSLTFLCYYALTNLIIQLIIFIIAINRHFSQKNAIIKLYPFHPDHCGGMGGFRHIFTFVSLLIILIGIWLTIFIIFPRLSNSFPQIQFAFLLSPIYLIISLPILFVLIWQPHRAMKRYRDSHLEAISQKILDIEREMLMWMKVGNVRKAGKLLAEIKILQELNNFYLDAIPIWPISLRRLGAIISSPLVISILTGIFLKLFSV